MADRSMPFDWRQKAVFVLTRGVLGWGVPCAIAMSLYESYRAGTWTEPQVFAGRLLLWGIVGAVVGLLQLQVRKTPSTKG